MTYPDKTKSRKVKYLYIAWLIIILLVNFQRIFAGYLEPETSWKFFDYLSFNIMQLSIGALIISFYVIPIYNKIRSVSSFFFKGIALIAHAFGYAFLYISSLSLTKEITMTNIEFDRMLDQVANLFFIDFHNSIKTYLIFISILFAHDAFERNAQSIIKQKDLENEINRVKFHSLKAQLQPHFLFNALNNIVALIDENKAKAQQSLIYLSELLRYTIRLEPSTLIDIKDEISVINMYLNIEKEKYESQLIINWEVSKGLDDFKVPPLILQPILENAIKYGFLGNPGKLIVSIIIKKGLLIVKNNGKKLDSELIEGTGLRLIKKRLRLHYNNNFDFSIYQDDNWTVNTIKIYDSI